MKKTLKRFLLISFVAVTVVIGVSIRLIFPPYTNLKTALAEGNFNATELFRAFSSNPTRAYLQLGKKVIILEGEVSETGHGYFKVGKDMSMVKCILRHTIYDKKMCIQSGNRVTVKGVCEGMNMTEVVISHCIILNNAPG